MIAGDPTQIGRTALTRHPAHPWATRHAQTTTATATGPR